MKLKSKVYNIRTTLFTILILTIITESLAQSDNEEESIKRNNIVLTIGHALIPTGEEPGDSKNLTTVPTWALSYEYRFSPVFILGLKSELEMSNYIIVDDEGTKLERDYPISLTLYAGFTILKGWCLYAGPGIEFERDENLYTATVGTLYEFELPGDWSLVPEMSYTLKGGHTGAYAIGLGVCKSF